MIHAPIFRDIGQPNAGLTPLVEEQTRIAMIRLDPAASAVIRLPQSKPGENTVSKQESDAALVLRVRRNILTAVSAGTGSTSGISKALKRDFTSVRMHCRWLAENGLAVETTEDFVASNGSTRKRMAFAITDAGRAWLEAQG